MAVKIAGGLTIVQDTREALCPEMPARAKQYAGAEYELPVSKIAELLVWAAGQGTAAETAAAVWKNGNCCGFAAGKDPPTRPSR
jgi:hypothetical protein